MAGKGSKPRPLSVDRKKFEDNWDRIFNKNKLNDNVLNVYNDERLVSNYDKQNSLTNDTKP